MTLPNLQATNRARRYFKAASNEAAFLDEPIAFSFLLPVIT
jgi:hypothetical protein